MAAIDILHAIKSRDWTTANQQFAQTMQQKLADRLAVERKTMFKEELQGFDAATVQRVYDENHDVSETEMLCNIHNLKVSDVGEVISFINKTY